MRPGQHSRVSGCGMLSRGKAAKNFLGPRRVMIHVCDDAKSKPGARLIRIFDQNFFKRSLGRTGILCRNLTLAFGKRGDDFCVIGYRRGQDFFRSR